MDVSRLHSSLQSLKEMLRNLIAKSADLIDRNSQIDNAARCDNMQPIPKFETLLEEFLSSCNMIELNLRTMQECLMLSKSSLQNLPITVSNLKCDNQEGRVEQVDANGPVSYHQYLTTIRYQVETAKSIKSILDDFVNQQNRLKEQQQSQHNRA